MQYSSYILILSKCYDIKCLNLIWILKLKYAELKLCNMDEYNNENFKWIDNYTFLIDKAMNHYNSKLIFNLQLKY